MTQEHKKFLDELRDSGEINMYGAIPYIKKEFKVSTKVAAAILKEWMETYEAK